jgi:hypothetical protein
MEILSLKLAFSLAIGKLFNKKAIARLITEQ